MVPIVLAAPVAAPTAVPTGDRPVTADLDAPPTHRLGLVLGGSFGVAVGGGSGYPNDSIKIGDPRYYSASGAMLGTSEAVVLMGALADYLNFGFWFNHADYGGGGFHSKVSAGGLRVEAFPLVVVYPRLSGLGLLGQFGIGSASMTSSVSGADAAGGTQSLVAAGAFYEWPFGKLMGGHFAVGPSIEYDAMWSTPFEQHGLVASARLVFYGGP